MIKKLISSVVSISIGLSMVTGAYAAVTGITDDLSDDTKIYSKSSNIIFETKSKLGNYTDPAYATSNEGTMEIVYELDDVSGFEVVTLNYKETKDITFYVSDKSNEGFTQLTDFDEASEELGSSWTKYTYTSKSMPDAKKYFKISINQTKAKYIRLDNVVLVKKFDLKLDSKKFSTSISDISGNNIYGAEKLTLKFNQSVNTIPDLIITDGQGDVFATVKGENGATKDIVIYEFDKLGFDKYSFDAKGFKTSSGMNLDVNFDGGYGFDFYLPQNIHFGDEYKTDDLISDITDCKGETITPTSIRVESDNEEILKVSEKTVEINKAGKANIVVTAVIDGIEMTKLMNITVCAPEEIVLDDAKFNLNIGDTQSVDVKLKLSDDTICEPQQVELTTTDDTVADIVDGKIKATGSGNTYINVEAIYYGYSLMSVISVGVDCEALDMLTKAEICINTSELFVGQSIATAVRGFYEDGSEVDMLASNRKVYSDDESVAKIENGTRIVAVGEGTASIYADIELAGATVRSNVNTVTVLSDSVSRARIILPRDYVLTGSALEPQIKAYTKTGREITPDKVTYSVDGKAVSVTDGIISGVEAGDAEVWAKVEFEGKSVTTDKVTIHTVNNNGLTVFDFAKNPSWDMTVAHSDNLLAEKVTGVLPCVPNDGVNPEYITVKSDSDINTVEIGCYAHTSIQPGEIRIFVSADNVEFTEIPQDDIEFKAVLDEGVWYDYTYQYSGKLLAGMKYVKAVITIDISKDASRAQTTQAVRLRDISLRSDTKAKVAGVSLTDKNGLLTNGTNARMIAVLFSQGIDKTSIDNIKLTDVSKGTVVNTTGTYDDGVYYMNVPTLDSDEYLLTVSGIKNAYGTVSDEFSYQIKKEEKNDIEILDVTVSEGAVNATIVNNTGSDFDTDVIVIGYDENGFMSGISVNRGVTVTEGVNKYSPKDKIENAETVKICLWDNFELITGIR